MLLDIYSRLQYNLPEHAVWVYAKVVVATAVVIPEEEEEVVEGEEAPSKEEDVAEGEEDAPEDKA